MFNHRPRTQEELNFRTKQRLGLLVLVGFVLFVAVKLWVVFLPILALGITAWVIRRTQKQNRKS